MIVKKHTTTNLVDLIVLCHNAVGVTHKFLQCAYHEPADFNLIIIDNNSTDATEAALKQFVDDRDDVTLVINDDNKGVIGGRNQGYEISADRKTKSKYIMFLDNDQFVKPGWLGHHVAVLEHGYDLIGVEAWQMSRDFLPVKKNNRLTDWFCYVGCGGSMMRRELPEKIGMFDDRFNPAYFEDPDLSFRAYDAGFKIGWNMKARVTHLPHQTLGHASDKTRRFMRSYQRFKEKWKGRSVPRLYQPNLPEFSQ